MTDIRDDSNRHLRTLTAEVLRDIARNGSCPRPYRLAAVESLMGRRSPYITHPDLAEFVEELNGELEGIQLEFPATETSGTGPLTASVTTKTMCTEEKVGFTGFDSVEISEESIDFPYDHNLSDTGDQNESHPAD